MSARPTRPNLNHFKEPIVLDPTNASSSGTPTPIDPIVRIDAQLGLVGTTDANQETRISTLETEVHAATTGLIDKVATMVAANVAAEATVDGSDAETTQALANALKVTVNAILTALKAAGLMRTDA